MSSHKVNGKWKMVNGIKKSSHYSLFTIHYKVGFTLIEFLVVIGVLVLVVGSTALFLASILKGANQASATAEVKQNGQAVLDSLERQIRGAVDVVGVGSANGNKYKGIKVVKNDGGPLYISCQTLNGNGRIATYTAATDSEVVNLNDVSKFTSVSNDDLRTGVNIDNFNCEFALTPGDVARGIPTVVGISFLVTQAINAPSRADFQASAKFQTTISLRTYK